MTRDTLAMIFVGLVAVAAVRAGTLAGVDMPDTVTVDGTTLVLNGMGLRQATVLRVKAYVGGLYLEQRTNDGEAVIQSKQLKRVTMKFLRGIDRKQLAGGWADELRKVSPQPSDAEIARFESFVPDVKTGDAMSFTWRPGAGVEIALNDKARGTMPDDFGRALFTLWFGPKPGDPNLKNGMLGG